MHDREEVGSEKSQGEKRGFQKDEYLQWKTEKLGLLRFRFPGANRRRVAEVEGRSSGGWGRGWGGCATHGRNKDGGWRGDVVEREQNREERQRRACEQRRVFSSADGPENTRS